MYTQGKWLCSNSDVNELGTRFVAIARLIPALRVFSSDFDDTGRIETRSELLIVK